MADGSVPWQLDRFLLRLDEWAALESPPDHIRRAATAWIMSRMDDPYAGVRREPGFPNLWWGPVPATEHHGKVVVCSYWIEEASHQIVCDSFATLSWPV